MECFQISYPLVLVCNRIRQFFKEYSTQLESSQLRLRQIEGRNEEDDY